MSSLNQKTIKNSFTLEGIGLHTGKQVVMTVKPAEPNFGIVFKRVDLLKDNLVVPNVYNVSNASYCTTITNDNGISVSTIEHLMGALYGIGIDNALIEIDNQEVPILDGSAKIFVEKVLNVGIEVSDTPIKIIKIEKEIELSLNGKNIKIKPSKLSLDIDFEIKYTNSLIGTQRNSIDVYKSNLEDIYSSRTFCLFEDVEKLRSNNLALGGSLDNAIVVKDNEVLNKEKLRNDKEFVNHKILDCMGDLYLSGYKILGTLICSQGGHMLTNQLLRKVFDNNSNFSLLEVKEKTVPNTLVNRRHLKSIA
ncbi:MAG: UDP-3-O-[3-hydroxymyristoyl] N-acetylglucosamine deacetylase [Pelagibacterales bacterium MED-G41]|nr:MAG: UDP-3-O-[3-hydroxymyristoyl] N-acetylglucosamine deacetylase [Pelagibacterales bacterium MED-G41]